MSLKKLDKQLRFIGVVEKFQWACLVTPTIKILSHTHYILLYIVENLMLNENISPISIFLIETELKTLTMSYF